MLCSGPRSRRWCHVSGPMQMYLYVHDAILRAVAGYEERARHLDRDDPADVAGFAGELDWFHTMVKAHEKAEEAVLFPALNERFVFVAEPYAYDHDDFEPHVFDGIDHALGGLQGSDGNGDRRELGELLHRQSIALHEHMRLHISKENDLLIPKLEAEFDLDEQAQLAGAMAGLFDPAMMGALVGWMYDGQDVQDREGMVRFLQRFLPPGPFAGLAGMLAARDTDAWSEMQRRIPELATPTG
jgi:hemerythrin-like domain-containing protein